jgi:citrate lyase subunit alpha/citrate CoA-transferase
LFDTQDFDAEAIRSLGQNPLHQETDCGTYANPHNSGAIVNYLDVVVLGATEIDTAMNVNVTTASDGRIIGGSGGHSDAAAGAKLTIVVTTSTRARLPVVRPEVTTVSTPGESIDVVVTERGIAPNPRRPGLMHKLEAAGLPAKHIEQICREVLDACGRPESLRKTDKVVALNEYRDGSVIDVVRQVN